MQLCKAMQAVHQISELVDIVPSRDMVLGECSDGGHVHEPFADVPCRLLIAAG